MEPVEPETGKIEAQLEHLFKFAEEDLKTYEVLEDQPDRKLYKKYDVKNSQNLSKKNRPVLVFARSEEQ